MASNYDIISATSDDVGNLSIPVSWDIENPETDLTVFILRNGSLSKWDGWNYNSNTGVIAVIGISEQFSAFVFRTEQAAILASLVSTNEVRVGDIISQLKKDNRVLEQLQLMEKVALRTCDEVLPIANSPTRAGKVLAFDADGNPDLSLAKEDVEGAYLARDEAKELKNKTAGLKSDAESYKKYAVDAAEKAVLAQGKAEEAEENTQVLKSSVEATVSEFNLTVNTKVQGVESAAQSGIEAVNSVKTAAVGNVNTAKTGALGEINTAKTDAVGDIAGIKGEVETAGQDAATEIAASLANAKSKIDTWSDQAERFAQNEEDISALAIDKANRGYLQFNKAKLTTATNNATSLPLTLCLTYDCDDWSSCVGKGFGLGGVVFFNTERVDWSNYMHYGFNFGIYSGSGNAKEIHLVTRSANNVSDKVANNYISFNKATGKHTLCVSISQVADFAVRFYQDGAFLGVRTSTGNSTSMLDEVGGISTGIHIATMANYASVDGQTAIPNLKLSRLKIFNCVLPATKADDTSGIGYTIEDYNNGIDEPPTMQDTSATYRALLSLQDYTVQNGSTQQVFDVSGNANDATATLSEGGSLKGSNDISVSRLIDFVKGQSA